MKQEKRAIAVIDLKAFYSYVECVDRGLDPWKVPLIVADKSRSVNTIILSVTPYLKSKGIPSRLRVKELPKGIDYIFATPRMERYIEMSAKITSIFLQFVSEEDLHVYSIDEAFIDLTTYLDYYKKTPKQIVKDIIARIRKDTGLEATAGIGDNFFLAKVALDLYAKKEKDGIFTMHKEDVPKYLWPVTPLSKIWGIGVRTEQKLNLLGIFTVEQLAKSNREYIRKKFGIMGDQLIDCANGIDESDIREVYVPKESSLTNGQTLMRDYSKEESRIIVQELVDDLSLRMRNEGMMCRVVSLYVGYSKNLGGFSRQISLLNASDDSINLRDAIFELYDKNIKDYPIRRLGICFGKLTSRTTYQQLDLFTPEDELVERHNLQTVTDILHNKFGKNCVLRASALTEASTIIERNSFIGGHRR